ncbi:hypothetical protein BU17DRAFT_102280 [Hysterangium stoloniferum]|nr:hypothetical protein BU17DRAFT_102280 [Hysterangium stoloniferum]
MRSMFTTSLPVELIREIVEIAVLSDTSTGPGLALVSKLVHHWVIPILYEYVSLDKRETIISFIQGVEAAQCGPNDPSKYITHLSIHRYAMTHCDWTLSICRDVQHLLICPLFRSPFDADDPAVDEISLWPQPRHIMVLNAPSQWLNPRRILFENTTHLYIDNIYSPSHLELCSTMPLSHICFGFWTDSDTTDALLEAIELLLAMPSMKIVLVHSLMSGAPYEFHGESWKLLAQITDNRLRVATGMSRDELIDLFESGQTVWDNIEGCADWRQAVQLPGL